MSDLPKIDVIIPCYHAHKTLLRTLSSIATQTILDDLEVTLVNDGGEESYADFVKMFVDHFKIREIVLKENMGPGDARQFGLDNTSNPLITFIDADDSFSGAFALKTLRDQLLAEPVNSCCFSNFLEEQPNAYIAHPNDSVWMFGKLYKRDFLKKYDIHFLPGSRANEDNGFNMICKLCANQMEQIKFIQDITYYWHFKEDSITRVNNCQYSYDQSFVGYVDNMIFAIKHSEKKVPFNGNINMQKVMIFCNLYEYYIETMARDTRFIDQNWGCCKKFYKEIYAEIEDKISDEILSEFYNEVMRNAYAGNKMAGIVPIIGFKEFMQKLKEENKKKK